MFDVQEINPGWVNSPSFKAKLAQSMLPVIKRQVDSHTPSHMRGASSATVRMEPPDNIVVEVRRFTAPDVVGAQQPVEAAIQRGMESLPSALPATRDAIESGAPGLASEEHLG